MFNNRVYRKVDKEYKLFIPKGVRNQVLRKSHDEKGHYSVVRTLKNMKERYWFPRMRQFVKKYIKSCVECAYNKIENQPKGHLHSIDKGNRPFETVHVDHLGPFVKSTRGNTYIIVLIDAFTKFAVIKALSNTQTSPVLKFLSQAFSTFGTPSRIITDKGSSFTSKSFADYVKKLNIQHVQNATKTPRANGQVERYNRTLLNILLTQPQSEEKWDQNMEKIQWNMNTTFNESINQTPFEVLFGYFPRDPFGDILSTSVDKDICKERNLKHNREMAETSIRIAQDKQRKYYNLRSRPAKQYIEGDLVSILNDGITSTGTSKKLENKYKGPYIIKKVLLNDRYIIEDIPGTQRTQRHFSSIQAADRMKKWVKCSPELDGDDSKEVEDDFTVRMDECNDEESVKEW